MATWHGTPDVRVRGAPFVLQRKEESEESDTESITSDGATTTFEAKKNFLPSNLPQTISTCVVSSSTEKRLHPDLPAIVPTILIDEHQFQVCLYDCENDVLLISEPVELAKKGGLSSSGMAILWLVINHRFFLQPLHDELAQYPSTIKSSLEAVGALDSYNELQRKDLNWDGRSKGYDNKELPFVLVPLLPPAKKCKVEF